MIDRIAFGKTLALKLSDALGANGVYLDQESPSDLAKLADAEAFLEAPMQ